MCRVSDSLPHKDISLELDTRAAKSVATIYLYIDLPNLSHHHDSNTLVNYRGWQPDRNLLMAKFFPSIY